MLRSVLCGYKEQLPLSEGLLGVPDRSLVPPRGVEEVRKGNKMSSHLPLPQFYNHTLQAVGQPRSEEGEQKKPDQEVRG